MRSTSRWEAFLPKRPVLCSLAAPLSSGILLVSTLLTAPAPAAWSEPPRAATPAFTDQDRDGVPDELETYFRFGTSIELPDSDGDGFSDGQEIAQFTNPTDPYNNPTASGSRQGVRIAVLPVDGDTFALVLVAWSPSAFADLAQVRLRYFVDQVSYDVTRDYLRASQKLHSEDGKTRSFSVLLNRTVLHGRNEMFADLWLDGARRLAVALFGKQGGTLYQARLSWGSDPNTVLAEYEYLPLLPTNPYSLTTSAGSPDKIFQEVLYVYTNGRYVVVRNNCDDRPNENCPAFISTVGQTGRIGPGH